MLFSVRSSIHGKANFDGHLPVMHLSLFDVAARFDHLKPAPVLDGFVSPLDGVAHGVLDGIGGSAGEFDEFVDGVFHVQFLDSRNRSLKCPLFATPGGGLFDSFTGFAGVLLNPTKQFLGLAFDILEIVVRELGSLLFQLTLDDVRVTFDFESCHKLILLFVFIRRKIASDDGKWRCRIQNCLT